MLYTNKKWTTWWTARLQKRGCRFLADQIWTQTLISLQKKTRKKLSWVLDKAFRNALPIVGIGCLRRKRKLIEIPILLPNFISVPLMIKWFLVSAEKRKFKKFALALAEEIFDAFNKKGFVVTNLLTEYRKKVLKSRINFHLRFNLPKRKKLALWSSPKIKRMSKTLKKKGETIVHKKPLNKLTPNLNSPSRFNPDSKNSNEKITNLSYASSTQKESLIDVSSNTSKYRFATTFKFWRKKRQLKKKWKKPTAAEWKAKRIFRKVRQNRLIKLTKTLQYLKKLYKKFKELKLKWISILEFSFFVRLRRFRTKLNIQLRWLLFKLQLKYYKIKYLKSLVRKSWLTQQHLLDTSIYNSFIQWNSFWQH